MGSSIKIDIRKEVRARISSLSLQDRFLAAVRIWELVRLLKEFIKAKVVMVYLAKEDEVDTRGIIEEARRQGKQVVVPKVKGEDMAAVELSQDFEVNEFGVLEPKGTNIVDLSQIDLVVTPARAFDRYGYRLGRGAGFYDRFFSKEDLSSAYKIGVCFSCQLVECLPTDEWDVPVDLVVSA